MWKYKRIIWKVLEEMFVKVKITRHLQIPKHLKIVLTFLLAVILAGTLFFMYKSSQEPGFVEEEIIDYAYTQKADVNYRVYLNPNPIYTETSLGSGNFYLTPFISNINTFFTYQFTGDKPVNYQGEYGIKAYLKGVIRDREELITVWSKEYELLPPADFSGRDKTVSLEREISLDFQNYNNFVEQFFEDTNIATEALLQVEWQVKITADAGGKELITEELCPTLVMPLVTSYFQITGEPTLEKQGAIARTVQRELPPDKGKVYALGCGAGIALTALILLLFFTKVPVIDPLVKSRKEIFKKHGDRLVALADGVIIDAAGMMPVKTLEDLVLIADEISKPVMYRDDSAEERKITFYVLDEPQIFSYELQVPEPEILEQPFQDNKVKIES
ncbi:MAG: DUF5305 family protein [Peptococcaceae bacterium]